MDFVIAFFFFLNSVDKLTDGRFYSCCFKEKGRQNTCTTPFVVISKEIRTLGQYTLTVRYIVWCDMISDRIVTDRISNAKRRISF